MTTRTVSKGGSQDFAVQYEIDKLQLDLTADRTSLTDGQASRIVGRDVLNRNRMAKAPGRRPVIITEAVPVDDLARHPLTTAIRSDFHGNATSVYTANSGPWEFGGVTTVFGEPVTTTARGVFQYFIYNRIAGEFFIELRDASTGDVPDERGEHNGIEQWGNFTPAMVGGLFQITSPLGYLRPHTITRLGIGAANVNRRIHLSLTEWEFPDDFFFGRLNPDLEAGETERLDSFEFHILSRQFFDKRGVWVSNGQKFWLLQGGKYTQFMDLGGDSGTLGTEWHGSQISPLVFMFVAPDQLPRVIRLGDEPTTEPLNEVTETEHLGGLLPPDGSPLQEQPAIFFEDHALVDDPSGTKASEQLSSSLDGIEASTADVATVYRMKVRVVDSITGQASAFVDCQSGDPAVDPFIGISRYHDNTIRENETGPEVPSAFIVFSRITQDPGGDFVSPFKTARATHIEFWRTTSSGIFYFLEYRKRLVWPADQFAEISLHFPGYTTKIDPYPGAPAGASAKEQNDAARTGLHAMLGMPDKQLVLQPQLIETLALSGGLPPACKDVISIQAMTVCGGTGETIVEYTGQDKTLRWPRLSTDEEVVHSEIKATTDALPLTESFFYGRTLTRQSDVRRLSRSGDTFQAFTTAGDIAVAVMRHGAHRIERAGDLFLTRALGDRGTGTPWPKTVLSIGDSAVWATTNGLRVYNSTANQGVGELQLVQYEPMSSWFAEALREGMDIEAGYDERRGVLHFRRTLDGELVNGAVYNLKFGIWSLVEDDNGFRYVASTHVDTEESQAAVLYSITDKGAVFEENYEGVSHPYDGFAVQGTIGQSYRWLGSNNGVIALLDQEFTPSMVGDIVRFRSVNPDLNGLSREIRTATGNLLEFKPLPAALTDGDEFIIAAVRYRVRFHPVSGSLTANTKTLEGLEVNAQPGERHLRNPAWGDRPEGKITVRAYINREDLASSVVPEDVAVFNDNQPEFTSKDRFSSIEAQGNTIELELESLDARSDFVITAVTGTFREDGDQATDTSTAA